MVMTAAIPFSPQHGRIPQAADDPTTNENIIGSSARATANVSTSTSSDIAGTHGSSSISAMLSPPIFPERQKRVQLRQPPRQLPRQQARHRRPSAQPWLNLLLGIHINRFSGL